MIGIHKIRQSKNKIVVLGNHAELIQSMLDFDYLSGLPLPQLVGIISGRSGFAKYFFGKSEVLIPTYISESQITKPKGDSNYWFLNLNSGRRTLTSTQELLDEKYTGGVMFAENTPEIHALNLYASARKNENLVVGPASVGLLIPGTLKLGPIGGITPEQILESHITEPGNVAVLSASGGMTNELINISSSAGLRLSFALSFGGDRFPTLTPQEAFLLAEEDPQTKHILYYGELGGEDEYELLDLKKKNRLKKNVIAHIAGTVASLFKDSPQFGHAKAKADTTKVSAHAKREALKMAGFSVSSSFDEFINFVNELK